MAPTLGSPLPRRHAGNGKAWAVRIDHVQPRFALNGLGLRTVSPYEGGRPASTISDSGWKEHGRPCPSDPGTSTWWDGSALSQHLPAGTEAPPHQTHGWILPGGDAESCRTKEVSPNGPPAPTAQPSPPQHMAHPGLERTDPRHLAHRLAWGPSPPPGPHLHVACPPHPSYGGAGARQFGAGSGAGRRRGPAGPLAPNPGLLPMCSKMRSGGPCSLPPRSGGRDPGGREPPNRGCQIAWLGHKAEGQGRPRREYVN